LNDEETLTMSQKQQENRFSFIPFFMLFVPCGAISYFCEKHEVWPAALTVVGAVTGVCIILFVVRNWAELLAGIFGSLLFIAILAGCAMIPFVGWIADILIFLFALGSVLTSIGALLPYGLKAAVIWGIFLVALMPEVFHPIASPSVLFLFSLGLGSALGKKASPFDEFILLMSSIPLLAMAIASLGKLFQSGIVMRNAQFRQHVSGYTTRAGVQVGDYTRTITKTVPVSTTSVNPGAVAIGSTAGQPAKEGRDA
jgi:hypothetical protein